MQILENCYPAISSKDIDVQLLGTNRHALTDSSGYWVFDSVPFDVYVARFSKPGYSESYLSAVEPDTGVWNSNKWDSFDIYRLPNWKVTLGEPQIQNLFDRYTISFPQATVQDSTGRYFKGFSLHCFVGRTPEIDYNDTLTIIGGGVNEHDSTTSTNGYDAEVVGHPLSKGDTIYVVGYSLPGCVNYQYSYEIHDTLKYGFSGFGRPSNIVKVIVP